MSLSTQVHRGSAPSMLEFINKTLIYSLYTGTNVNYEYSMNIYIAALSISSSKYSSPFNCRKHFI